MEGTIGEVRMFAGNFAPRTWAFCEGQLLAINSNQALFSILGTTYGGDGRTSFGLPDLRGRVPINPGTGAGLPTYREGQKGGSTINILNVTQIPSHNHNGAVKVSSGNSTQNEATNGASIATPGTGSGRSFNATAGFNTASPDVTLNANSVVTGNTGGNQAVNNMQPFLSIYYIICLQGIFPSRN
ncbi:phage tail protein [Aquimarina spinulae]|uniref:phage tail protein n=1 Tax=Aquimarina spinulae TaxID=1192023 RepID=UPI000D55F4FE|nr:tail fiber protein [Aquimarina spinulae]